MYVYIGWRKGKNARLAKRTGLLLHVGPTLHVVCQIRRASVILVLRSRAINRGRFFPRQRNVNIVVGSHREDVIEMRRVWRRVSPALAGPLRRQCDRDHRHTLSAHVHS